MRTALKSFFAVLFALCAAAAYADPPGRVARLNYAAGPVSFAPAEAPQEWGQAVVNRPLTNGDRLWVDRGGRAELHAGPNAVRFDAGTQADIGYLDDSRVQLRVNEGNVNVRARDIDRDDLVEITTPDGVVRLREPGSYRITADPSSNGSRVTAYSGYAELVGQGQAIPVQAGQSVVFTPGAPVSYERAHAGDDFDRWAMERDRRGDRVLSTRYVSPHMTGYEDLDQYGSWRSVPEYGNVWFPQNVAHDWAPYRHGHWEWISPWGWTWIDDAPWGFAPSHYGRWVRVYDHWGWAPGPIVRRPVYAPALVGFIGGSSWSVSGHGPAVGWFPLGWREPYRPWYRASPTYVRNVNHVHVTNITNVHVTHVHRHRHDAVTVVPRDAFVSARPAWRSRMQVARNDLDRAPIARERPAEPTRASIAPERPGAQPPERLRGDDGRRGWRERFAAERQGNDEAARQREVAQRIEAAQQQREAARQSAEAQQQREAVRQRDEGGQRQRQRDEAQQREAARERAEAQQQREAAQQQREAARQRDEGGQRQRQRAEAQQQHEAARQRDDAQRREAAQQQREAARQRAEAEQQREAVRQRDEGGQRQRQRDEAQQREAARERAEAQQQRQAAQQQQEVARQQQEAVRHQQEAVRHQQEVARQRVEAQREQMRQRVEQQRQQMLEQQQRQQREVRQPAQPRVQVAPPAQVLQPRVEPPRERQVAVNPRAQAPAVQPGTPRAEPQRPNPGAEGRAQRRSRGDG